MRRWVWAVFVLVVVTGCAGARDRGPVAAVRRPTAAYEDRLLQQAHDALARWDAAVAASAGQAPRAFVPGGRADRAGGHVGAGGR